MGEGNTFYVYTNPQDRSNGYGCLSFMGDLFMICITGGLWLIWIFIREMRKR
jgi:hypothetical protein